MSESPIPKISACPSERSRSGRRHSYNSYCDKEMEGAFRRSLASIHYDCPARRMPRSNHNSMADYCNISSRIVTNSDQSKIDAETTSYKTRRASMNDLPSYAKPQRVSEFSPISTILNKDGAIVQGILRAPSELYVLLCIIYI